MDSSTVCLKLCEGGFHVLPHFVNYGQRAATSEWAAAQTVANWLGLDSPSSTDVSSLGDALDFALIQGSDLDDDATFDARFQEAFVPHRNLFLAACASMYAASRGIDTVALGIVGGGAVAYGDTTPSFVRRLQGLLRLSTEVRVLAPFANKTKDDVVRYGWERDFDYGLTYSCQQQSGVHCGSCAGCIERDLTLSMYPFLPDTRTHAVGKMS
jgi:7-cyano-7-deazaguanine synthase